MYKHSKKMNNSKIINPQKKVNIFQDKTTAHHYSTEMPIAESGGIIKKHIKCLQM